MQGLVGHAVRRLVAALSALLLVLIGSAVVIAGATAARADTVPPDPATPATVSADGLPTVQINGVVWAQVTVGNTVYATGSFTSARPAGSASGSNETARGNLVAYDITTGVMTGFNHSLNAQGKTITASPDGTKIFVGGDFTTVDGIAHSHLAAFNTATGALLGAFTGNAAAEVLALTATNSTLYVGGIFASAGGAKRNRLAAFTTSTGALLNWAPTADDDQVAALQLTPDQSKVVVGGKFSTLNGVSAFGLGAVDATTGATLPWAANSTIQNSGAKAGITSLRTDGTKVYATGFVFGPGGNLEGTVAMDPGSGGIVWIEDCHGDSYDTFENAAVVYVVSHEHYCGNIGGFPQTNPWTFHRATAFTAAATQTVGHNQIGGYYDFFGQPAPTLLDWYPTLTAGSYTGQTQAAWSATGNSSYLALGGEFPAVNGVAQQGLVRFAIRTIAPNKIGPQFTTTLTPKVVSLASGTMRVAWTTTYDVDNQALVYKVYRDGNLTSPIYTKTINSQLYQLSSVGFVDTGLVPGSTHTYRVFAYDPFNNQTSGSTVSATVSAATTSPYAQDVVNDGAGNYWRLGEASGTTGYDSAGFNDLVEQSGVADGATGAITGDPNTAATFDGSGSGTAGTSSSAAAPQVFTTEAWVNTTSTSGGKIIGYGDQQVNTSSSYDRLTYMDNAGHLIFGIYDNGVRTISGPGVYNDGAWHHVVSTLSSAGMVLYVDGKRVAKSTATVQAADYVGFWRVGGDNVAGWTNSPASNDLAGAIDEVAVYPTALSLTQVQKHYTDSGRTVVQPAPPTDTYGKAVYKDNPDFYWRLDEAAGPTAFDTTLNESNGTYQGGLSYHTPSTVTGPNGTGVTFNGSDGLAVNNNAVTDPTVYSEELWFDTTTTHGGKLIGFGSSQTGTSGSYDRHVWMLDTGQLVFGVYTGQTVTVTSPLSYNDGNWHHMVATQGPDGIRLYVDSTQVGSNPETTAQNYTGYWRIGGDNVWFGADSNFFAGVLDEVAVYPTELTPAQVLAHYAASPDANLPPVAAFTSSCTNLTCTFDASGSTDPNGTIGAYSWDFGDGTSGTGPTPTHTYASGTYTATLTVTDNGGRTATVSHQVTATNPPVNQAPVASFTSTCTNLTCAFDAGASVDTDGTIASYAWDFGDGTAGTGVTPTHDYTAGTYTVTLTVTDNQGATGTANHIVTPTDPPANQPPVASFTSTCTNLTCAFDASNSVDPDGTIASYAWTFGDGTTGTGKTVTHTYTAGTYTVQLTVTDNQGLTGTSSQAVSPAPPANTAPVAAFTSACTNLACTFDGSGSADPDGTVASYAWVFGDGTTGTGATPAHTYTAAGTFTVRLTVTDNQGATGTVSHPVTVTAAPANQLPVAAFSSSCPALTCAFDGSGSSDPDGTVASYAWNFGDGTTGTGATPSHAYAAAGDYPVSLRVTDDQGGTNAITHTVVPSPPANPVTAPYAVDTFNRTVKSGFGTADVGGAWTNTGGAGARSVSVGMGSTTLSGAGAQAGDYLPSVSATGAETDATLTTDKVGTGNNGLYLYVIGRRVGTNLEYRARVRLLPSGAIALAVTELNNSATESIVKGEVTLAGVTYTPGMLLKVRFQVTGTNPTTLRMKVWPSTATEPTAWQISTTDATAALQAAGAVGVTNYLSSSSTNSPVVVSIDAFSAAPTAAAPVASFTAACTGQACSVDGSGTTDPNGNAVTYTWSWGDGTITTGVTATHTFVRTGSVRITLTATNSIGYTSVTTRTVTLPG